MSIKNTILINAEEDIKTFFGELFDKSDERIMKAARHGVSNALNVIRDATYKNVQSIPYNMTRPTKKYGVPLIEGIKTYVYKNEPTGFVDVLGNRQTNDGTWMLRFFAGGGAIRKNRGEIRGYLSLKAAYNTTMSKQTDEIRRSIEAAIDEINNK